MFMGISNSTPRPPFPHLMSNNLPLNRDLTPSRSRDLIYFNFFWLPVGGFLFESDLGFAINGTVWARLMHGMPYRAYKFDNKFAKSFGRMYLWAA